MRGRKILEHGHLVVFHRELVQGDVNGNPVLAAPTSRAVVVVRQNRTGEHAVQGQIPYAVDPEEVLDLIEIPVIRQKFFFCR